MTTITFTLHDKYANKSSQINRMIKSLDGDYSATQTKDGAAYIVDFEDDKNGSTFQEWINKLIPDLYKY